MIDSNKLLPDRGTTITLSKGSVKKVALIERKLTLIDSLLKEKLILSKVREGIRREEEERLKRIQQEIDLEKDEDDKDDPDAETKRRRKPKDPKDGGGVSLIGSALIGAGGVALAKNAGLIIGAAKVATALIGGTLFVGVGVAKAAKSIDNIKSQVASFGPGGAAALKTAGLFTQVLSNFVGASIAVGIFNSLPANLTGFKLRKKFQRKFLDRFRLRGQTSSVLSGQSSPLLRGQSSQLPLSSSILRGQSSQLPLSSSILRGQTSPIFRGQSSSLLRGQSESIFRGQRSLIDPEKTLKMQQSLLKPTIVRAPNGKVVEFPPGVDPNKLNPNDPRYRRQFAELGMLDQNRISIDEGIDLDVMREVYADIDLTVNKIREIEMEMVIYRNTMGEKGINPKDGLIRVKNLKRELKFKKKGAQQTIDSELRKRGLFPEEVYQQLEFNIENAGGGPVDTSSVKSSKFFDGQRFRTIDPENIFYVEPTPFFNRTSSRPTNRQILQSQPFFEAPNIPQPPLTSKQILSQQGSFNAPKIINQVTKNADNLTNVKSLSTLLEAFGGIPLVKATRKLFDNTLGRIPLLGDLLGLLLDIYVFNEPPERAIFMMAGGALGGSIGAWLGGILGTAVPVVGNLAGAVVGGFLGGVGGDMLGGFLYDRIIGGKQDPQPLTEKALKSTSRLALNGGGLVPNLAMQGGGMTPDVGSFASYENPRGRVAVKTILLPLNSESDEASEATVLAAGRSKGRSNFETLYKGGLA